MDAPIDHIPAPPRRPPRRRRYGVTALAGLTMLVTQCAPQQCAPAPSAQVTPTLQQVVDLTNAHRRAAGVAPLTINAQLNASAQGHSNDMAAMNTMSHTGSDGSDPGGRITAAGYVFRAWGENVAAGYPDATSVDQGWWNSSGHRRNMLDPNFTEIGVGLAYSTTGVPYWTQDFGRPRT
jgi:uncharacterized protein YkwD